MGLGYSIVPALTSGGVLTIVDIPYQSNTLTYKVDTEQSPTWNNFNNKQLQVEFTPEINAGTYTATFTPINDCRWLDGSDKSIQVQWVINKKKIATENIVHYNTSLVFKGDIKKADWKNGDTNKKLNLGDQVLIVNDEQTNAGTYTATFTPTSNYCWPSGTFEPKSFPWTIKKLEVPRPTVVSGTTNFTYNGEQQGPSINEYNTKYIDVINATSINAGNYNLIFRLKDKNNCVWTKSTNETNYTTNDVVIPYTINQSASELKLKLENTELKLSGTTNIVFTPTKQSYQLDYSYTGDGTINIVTNKLNDVNTYKVTHDIFNKIIVISALKTELGYAELKISFNAGDNYLATAVKTFRVYVTKPTNILTNRTFEDINTIIAAGNANNYFRIGDYMPVTLNGYVSRFPGNFSTTNALNPDGLYNIKVGFIADSYIAYAFIIGIDHNSGVENNVSGTTTLLDNNVNRVHFCLGAMSADEAENQGRTEFEQICFFDRYFSKSTPKNDTENYKYSRFTFDAVNKNKRGWEYSFLRFLLNGDKLVYPETEQSTTTLAINEYDTSFVARDNTHPFLNILPSALQSVIKSQVKYTVNPKNVTINSTTGTVYDNYNNTDFPVSPTLDKLWLLSPFEIQGASADCCITNEKNWQKQYDYFKNGNSYRCLSYISDHPVWGLNYAEVLTRSVYSKNLINFVMYKSNSDKFAGCDSRYSRGIRPCFSI